jgi:hypothetical protein
MLETRFPPRRVTESREHVGPFARAGVSNEFVMDPLITGLAGTPSIIYPLVAGMWDVVYGLIGEILCQLARHYWV